MSLFDLLQNEDLDGLVSFVSFNVPPEMKSKVIEEFHDYILLYQEKHRGEKDKGYCLQARKIWRAHMNEYCQLMGYDKPFIVL